MLIEDNTLVRIGFASDVLINKFIQNNHSISWFKNDKHGPEAELFHSLLSVSLIYSISEILNRSYLIPKIQPLFDSIILKTVQRNDSKFISTKEGSLVSWNALVVHILIKQKKYEQAMFYANSIVESITDRIHRFVPGSGVESAVTTEPGLVILSLLEMFQYSQNDKYLISALKCAPMLISYKQLNPRNGWGLAAIWEYNKWTENPEWNKHIDNLANNINVDPKIASGVVVPYMIQTLCCRIFTIHNTSKLIPSHLIHRLDDLLNIQANFQVDIEHNYGYNYEWNGAFIKEPADPVLRIDYLLYSVFAYIQYLLYKKQRKISETLHIY